MTLHQKVIGYKLITQPSILQTILVTAGLACVWVIIENENELKTTF